MGINYNHNPIHDKEIFIANNEAGTIITSEEVRSGPKLVLEIIESPTIPKDTQYESNAAGYIHSKRGANDGRTYIGTGIVGESSNECPNDIIVPSEEIGMGGTHLLIQYNPETKSYYIRDCG